MRKTLDIQPESGEGLVNAGYVMRAKETLVAPGAGEWYFFPRGADGISIILSSTGDGRVEATNAAYANIVADTVAAEEIVPWDAGNIGAVIKSGFLCGANAFRQVNISGTTVMTVSAIN